MKIGKYEFDFQKNTYICGILNVTPDSFSDGGKYFETDRAVENALGMIDDGASIIDIGGESTRPGFLPVSGEEEKRRVIPVIEALRAKSDIPISIDTMKADVAKAAVEAGADMVNDVSGFLNDDKMAEVVSSMNVCCVLTHNANYVNREKLLEILREISITEKAEDYLKQLNYDNESYVNRVAAEMYILAQYAKSRNVGPQKILLDPGIGFKGSAEHDHMILNALCTLTGSEFPIFLGVSRKSCVKAVVGDNLKDRDAGTVAISTLATLGGVGIVRVHNVRDNFCAVRMTEEICRYE